MQKSTAQRVAVITGASSGIGKAAAIALARQGWRVIGLGRNPERCEAARTEIQQEAADGGSVQMICANLALMSEVVRVADEIAASTDHVNALLNNAGGLTRELVITPEGNENTFASNHLGHFLLTNRLLPLLRKAAADFPAGTTRVINVSSLAHEYCDGLDWDDLQSVRDYDSNPAYCRVKLANVLFTRELARRVAGDGIVAHAMHPGMVASNFASHGDDAMQERFIAQRDRTISPEQAADTLVWLATADEAGASSGNYYFERASVTPSAPALDEAAARRLWEESEKLVTASLGQGGKSNT